MIWMFPRRKLGEEMYSKSNNRKPCSNGTPVGDQQEIQTPNVAIACRKHTLKVYEAQGGRHPAQGETRQVPAPTF